MSYNYISRMITTFDNKQWDEKDILQRMIDDEFYYGYLGSNALSKSACSKLLLGPKAYLKSLRKTNETQALRDGRLIHLCTLEPHRIKDLTIVDIASKRGKAWDIELTQNHPQMVYTQKELNYANSIANELLNCKDVSDYLNGAEFEVPGIKMINNLAFRGKADVISKGTIIDVKTTTKIDGFKYSAKNFDYDLQAALYLKLFDCYEFIFIAIDKETKEIKICPCDNSFIERGEEKLEIAIDKYREYLEKRNELHNHVTYEILE